MTYRWTNHQDQHTIARLYVKHKASKWSTRSGFTRGRTLPTWREGPHRWSLLTGPTLGRLVLIPVNRYGLWAMIARRPISAISVWIWNKVRAYRSIITFNAAGTNRRHSKMSQIFSKKSKYMNFITIFGITMRNAFKIGFFRYNIYLRQ